MRLKLTSIRIRMGIRIFSFAAIILAIHENVAGARNNTLS